MSQLHNLMQLRMNGLERDSSHLSTLLNVSVLMWKLFLHRRSTEGQTSQSVNQSAAHFTCVE